VVLLPLMANAGIGGLVGDAVERVSEERKTRDKDALACQSSGSRRIHPIHTAAEHGVS